MKKIIALSLVAIVMAFGMKAGASEFKGGNGHHEHHEHPSHHHHHHHK